MSIIINSESKVEGPTWIGSLIFLMTSHLVPSNAQTTIWLFFKLERSISNLDNVDIGITLNDEPLSRRACGITWLLHLMVMWSAFVLSQPSRGISSSVKQCKHQQLYSQSTGQLHPQKYWESHKLHPRHLEGHCGEYPNSKTRITRKALSRFCSVVQ